MHTKPSNQVQNKSSSINNKGEVIYFTVVCDLRFQLPLAQAKSQSDRHTQPINTLIQGLVNCGPWTKSNLPVAFVLLVSQYGFYMTKQLESILKKHFTACDDSKKFTSVFRNESCIGIQPCPSFTQTLSLRYNWSSVVNHRDHTACHRKHLLTPSNLYRVNHISIAEWSSGDQIFSEKLTKLFFSMASGNHP